jgi:uncharacterized protein YqeY
MLEERLEQDIKTALLARDTHTLTTLRGLKATLLNIKVASGKRGTGLDDDEVIEALSKEAKKRQESADLYKQGGNSLRANLELKEKKIIQAYLPEQISENELTGIIEQVIKQSGAIGMSMMGQVIGLTKAKVGAQADGSLIAKIVKEKLQ